MLCWKDTQCRHPNIYIKTPADELPWPGSWHWLLARDACAEELDCQAVAVLQFQGSRPTKCCTFPQPLIFYPFVFSLGTDGTCTYNDAHGSCCESNSSLAHST